MDVFPETQKGRRGCTAEIAWRHQYKGGLERVHRRHYNGAEGGGVLEESAGNVVGLDDIRKSSVASQRQYSLVMMRNGARRANSQHDTSNCLQPPRADMSTCDLRALENV